MQGDALQQLAEAVPVPMLVVDAAARVVIGNRAATAMLGEGITDRPFVTVLRQSLVNRALEQALDRAGAAQRLSVTISARGHDRNCVVTVTPLTLNGRPGAGVVIEDTSGVEHAEQMRRDFVANVSHELKTPLTALMGFIETLRGPARNDAAARERFLAIMDREAGRMNRLIGDLLSLSRVEQEERRRPSERVDLAGLIRSACATLAPTAQAAGTALVKIGTGVTAEVAGDADQIQQVLHNLIENAIKYGARQGGASGGEVRVTLTHVPHEPVLRGPGWAVEVADDGEGIDEVHLPRLTERFYRVDNHRSREKGGTGLGLAIVKHIVARHRGRLKIESTRGAGSRFTIIPPEWAGAR
ncbi:sensor histidine kinase [Paracoccus sanguinis]|uniref:sensor histidine kinase n=1 Tax=Paracoccus sanguinis TaxID=1545044 RepID=UPI00051FEA60|nr:ATP-binding protein [Paracoccus sanguinis]KGJ16029.1 ATPase [Paracoccus sanguinis]